MEKTEIRINVNNMAENGFGQKAYSLKQIVLRSLLYFLMHNLGLSKKSEYIIQILLKLDIIVFSIYSLFLKIYLYLQYNCIYDISAIINNIFVNTI